MGFIFFDDKPHVISNLFLCVVVMNATNLLVPLHLVWVLLVCEMVLRYLFKFLYNILYNFKMLLVVHILVRFQMTQINKNIEMR